MGLYTPTADIKQFKVFTKSGSSQDISGGIHEFNYYESIFDNTTRCQILFTDVGARSGGNQVGFLEEEGNNINGGEKVLVALEDTNGFKLNYATDSSYFRLYRNHFTSQLVQSSASIFNLYSNESIENQDVKKRVMRNYTGKISDTVYDILKNILKTPKTIKVESTANSLNVTGKKSDTGRPFYVINELSTKSVPTLPNSLGNLAGFLFYEIGNENGAEYHYRSIDSITKQNYVRKLILNDIINNESIPLPPSYTGKILKANVNKTIDLDEKLFVGDYGNSILRSYDPRTQKIVETAFNSGKQLDNILGTKRQEIATEYDFSEITSSFITKSLDTGWNPPGKNIEEQLGNSDKQNLDTENIIRQSWMRYHQMITVDLTIKIYVDLGLHVGDIIFCDFREVSLNSDQRISSKQSGLYMIAELRHKVVRGQQHYTILSLVRDSIGRKTS